MTADFLSETMETKGKCHAFSIAKRTTNYQLHIPQNYRNKEEIKTFSDAGKVRNFSLADLLFLKGKKKKNSFLKKCSSKRK